MKEKKVKRFLAIVILMFVGMLYINDSFTAKSMAVSNMPIGKYEPSIISDSTNVDDSAQIDIIEEQQNQKEVLRIRLIDDVDKHIRKNHKIHDKNLPMYLVDYSIEYNIDLCFMMAQTKLETGFGTMGAGRPTSRHSLFGVVGKWKNYSCAIEDYCKLLKKSYLGDRKTEHDLMKNFVTLGGARYAGNRRYEIELSAEYKKIRANTQIYELWNELRNS